MRRFLVKVTGWNHNPPHVGEIVEIRHRRYRVIDVEGTSLTVEEA